MNRPITVSLVASEELNVNIDTGHCPVCLTSSHGYYKALWSCKSIVEIFSGGHWGSEKIQLDSHLSECFVEHTRPAVAVV